MKNLFKKIGIVSVLLFCSSVQAVWADDYSALIVDAMSGKVIYSQNARDTRYPASLTKLMTLYLLFEAVENGQLSLSQEITFSKTAAGQEASNLKVKAGDTISVDVAIRALTVKSANDVAVAVAEAIDGSQANFAKRMNAAAKKLGMNQSNFVNPNGLPSASQTTTAWDLYLLARGLMRDYPKYYPYFNLREFSYKGQTHKTHNRVLLNYTGADGLKTGYIRSSGFQLVSSARQGNYRLIGVVLGGKTAALRDQYIMSLFDAGFLYMQRGTPVNVPVYLDDKGRIASLTEPVNTATASTAKTASSNKPTKKSEKSKESKSKEAKSKAQPAVSTGRGSGWRVQVGVFSSSAAAQSAANAARRIAGQGSATVEPRENNLYRAILSGFSNANSAKDACSKLKKQSKDCLVIKG